MSMLGAMDNHRRDKSDCDRISFRLYRSGDGRCCEDLAAATAAYLKQLESLQDKYFNKEEN